jgi:hypothetical protein
MTHFLVVHGFGHDGEGDGRAADIISGDICIYETHASRLEKAKQAGALMIATPRGPGESRDGDSPKREPNSTCRPKIMK